VRSARLRSSHCFCFAGLRSIYLQQLTYSLVFAGKTDSFPASHKDSLYAILSEIEGIYSSSLQHSQGFSLAAQRNMVQNKAAMKRYDSKESDQNNHKFDFVHDLVNPNFKRRGMSYVSEQSSLEMRNDNLPKAKINLAEAKGDNIIAVISHVKLTNVSKWVVDSGATRHICVNRDAFTSYTILGDNEKLVYLTDSQTATVSGKGKILLKLTSGKTLALTNVLHVPSIKTNLISVSLLAKNGVNVSFESDKIILTKKNIFVGKGYCDQGLFILNISEIINYKASSFAYLIDSYDI
jgi:hypothetical protein